MARPRISFEYFPPKTDAGRNKLLEETTPALVALDPEFFSVTYGAGGTTRDTTMGVVSSMQAAGIQVAPHLSFGGDDENAVEPVSRVERQRRLVFHCRRGQVLNCSNRSEGS